MSFKDCKVFVSGGAGVIGLELVNKLYELGAIIFVGDLKPKPKEFQNDIIYWQGDLNYIEPEILIQFEPEYFFHLAATFERTHETPEFWQENYHHNIRLTHYLLNILKNINSLKRVVFTSSYLVYDSKNYLFDKPQKKAIRLSEKSAINPRNLIGASKLFNESEINFFSQFNTTHFSVVSVRIFRSYGKNSRDIISRWIRDLLDNKEILLYAKEGMFDYIYAGEVATGLIKIALSNYIGIVNLGNDNARPVSDIIKILSNNFSIKIKEIEHNIPFEASQADMDKFKQITKWMPSKQLEDTIPEIISYEIRKKSKENQIKNFNLLITSISKKIPLLKSLRFALQKLGNDYKIFGGDIDNNCLGKYFVDNFWLMPDLKNLNVKELLTYCLDKKIKAIIPTRDGELKFFSINKDLFNSNGINVMISPLETVEICIDKLLFFKKLNELSLPVVYTSENINNINSEKYVVKERFGAGSKYIGINLKKDEAINHAKNLRNPLFQSFIDGEEISVDLYVDKKGNLKGLISRVRELVVNGESQITHTIIDDNIEKLCKSICRNISFYGHVILQLIKDKDYNYHIIECNCRFGGASTLSVTAGLDSFYWFLLETLGEDISSYPFVRCKRKLKQIRYPEDLIIYGDSF